MPPLTMTFEIPTRIISGLADGSLVRNGGVIQDRTGRVFMWLRELNSAGSIPMSTPNLLSGVDPVTGILNLPMQGVNAEISMRGFASVTQQLDQIQGTLNIITASSMLNLGVSVIGFALILKKVKELEGRLEKVQKILEKIDQKIDLSFYANFKAALDLAMNAFTMCKGDNRKTSALNAINRFLEAEHIYTNLVDKELSARSQVSNEYLLTLCFAYIAEARCYLELEEFDTAIRRFQEGQEQVKSRIEKYVDTLLSSNPLMYLHPSLKDKTNLPRLTRIYQWKDSSLDEVRVFELLREHLVPQSDKSWSSQVNDWIKSLPLSMIGGEDINNFWGIKEEVRVKIIQKLPEVMADMESMIETNQRFSSYELEVKAISQLGISFREWLQLQPPESAVNNSNLMYIVPDEPMILRD